jgi:hypothetical protein
MGFNSGLKGLMICTSHQILSSDQIQKNRMGEACSTMREKNGLYSILLEKHEEKRPFERSSRRWGVNIKLGLQKVRWRHGLD